MANYSYKTKAGNKREMRGLLKDAKSMIRDENWDSLYIVTKRINELASELDR